MQLFKVAFSALFSPPLYQAVKPKNSISSPPLYQGAKPKIVIPGYMVQRKSASVIPQSLLCHFYV